MLKSKVCCVLALALIDSLWVQALPSFASLDEYAIHNGGRFRTLECPENEFLNHEGKACEPTCEDIFRPDVCEEKKVIACECNDGYVRNATGACIRPERCFHQLPPKSKNTLSASRHYRQSGVLIEVFEPSATEHHDNDTEIESQLTEGEAYDLEDFENVDAVRSELEFDPGLLEHLSDSHNAYHRKHITEHQPDQSEQDDEREAQIKRFYEELFGEGYTPDDSDEKDNNNVGLINIDDWFPTIFK
ncbi:uncharacterized protein [Chelonus insularis]|uniref:uncharacterized protein n=1 Tax=Chelonus insularis TaxID=460826 RepID=UPI00158E8A5A|nr:uncharacterized protein LOC118067847 [Chelonus insularis]